MCRTQLAKQNTRTTASSFRNSLPGKKNEIIDPNEAKVNQKLEQLYRELNKAQEPAIEPIKEESNATTSDPQFSSDVKDLEKMM